LVEAVEHGVSLGQGVEIGVGSRKLGVAQLGKVVTVGHDGPGGRGGEVHRVCRCVHHSI
jgi:hypothetical protein